MNWTERIAAYRAVFCGKLVTVVGMVRILIVAAAAGCSLYFIAKYAEYCYWQGVHLDRLIGPRMWIYLVPENNNYGVKPGWVWDSFSVGEPTEGTIFAWSLPCWPVTLVTTGIAIYALLNFRERKERPDSFMEPGGIN